MKNKTTKKNQHLVTHGLTKSPEYYIWRTMKARCFNPKSASYKRYGFRGIKVCERWVNSFALFYADMGPRPSKFHQIDRINNDDDYTPNNCRWVTVSENSSNRQSNNLITYNGDTLTAAEWGKRLGLNRGAIQKRLNKGWSTQDAMTIPRLPRHLRTKSPTEIKKALGL